MSSDFHGNQKIYFAIKSIVLQMSLSRLVSLRLGRIVPRVVGGVMQHCGMNGRSGGAATLLRRRDSSLLISLGDEPLGVFSHCPEVTAYWPVSE
jgi:hypothetical protein